MGITRSSTLFFVLIFSAFAISCKKKSKVEDISFDYTYPEISFSFSDSATFGSTTDGWTYIVVEKIDNRDYLKTLTDKKVYAKDVSMTKLTSCTFNLVIPADSSFNTFDSAFVKIGGLFVYGGVPYFSAYDPIQVAERYPILADGARSLVLNPVDINMSDQIGVDPDVAFRVKLVSMDHIVLPSHTFKATITVSVTAKTH